MTGIISDNVGRTSGLIKAASGGGGVWTKIKTLTASSDATLSFVDGTDDVVLDSTYPIYVFKFINIHPETNAVDFLFQADIGTDTDYDQTITSTHFIAAHQENDSDTSLSYRTSGDLAQSTSFQQLNEYNTLGSDNDESLSGTLTIYNPSSSTFVKHFMATTNLTEQNDYQVNSFIAGYFNTTTALTRFQFKMSADSIEAGKIKLYGLKDSA
jgi:hypothetical protein